MSLCRPPGARTSAVARTRFLDDLVERYVAEGIRQVVVLGAGFDSRAHRLAELSASVVFEVDRPDTQRAKQAVLGRRPPVARVRYVPADLLADDLGAALGDAGWDAAMATVFLWEGVTNYLTADAVASVLAWIGAVPGRTVLAFTYVHAGLLDGSVRFDGGTQMLENVRALGEPWTFGLRPTEVGAFLERCGLALSEELGADEYRARYLPAEPDGWRGYAFYRLAVATNRIRAEGKGIPA